MGELEKSSLLSPSFFTIYLPHFHGNGTLELPDHFVKEHWKSFSKNACLELPTGTKFKMKLKKSNNGRAWLHKGWDGFVKKYSINYGYLLVFRYQERSNFIVQIFDRSTGQIMYANTNNQKQVGFVIKREDCDAEHCPTEDRSMDNQSTTGKLKAGKKSSSVENKSEVVVQKAKALQSRNPQFSVTMKPAYVTYGSRITCYMHIPRDAASYFRRTGKYDIQLSLSGRVWSMKYYFSPPPYCSARIGLGWREFSEENNLKEGDTCTFERVSGTGMKFKVTISRIKDEQNEGHIGLSDVVSLSPRGTKRKRGVSVKEKSTAIECNETSFTATIKKTQVGRNSRLNIPRAHSGRHLLDQHGNDIFLHRVGGKTWRVRCNIYGIDVKFLCGWKEFVDGNDLQVGDTCVFDLSPTDPNHYNVTISSGAGSSSSPV